MRLLVTGGAGFIGSNYVRYVLREHPEDSVLNLDKLTYAGNLENLREVESDARYAFVRGDICDERAVEGAMARVEAVVNLAAESHVDRSILSAGSFVDTDIKGLYILLEAARKQGIERFLHVSTDEVYGSIEQGSFAEEGPFHPSSPYAASKAGAELLGWAYAHTFDYPILVTRGSNTYGPYQYPEKVIPLFITNAIDDHPLPLYGDGLNVRDWLYVEDHCRGIDLVLREGIPAEAYNLGADQERTNLEVTRRILALLGKGEDLIEPVADRPGHDRRYSLNSAKAKALGWTPRVGFEDGLAQTVGWYQQNEAWWRRLKDESYMEYYRRMYGSDRRPG